MTLEVHMHVRTLIATLLFGFMAAAPALAGPPILCHPNSIGSAQSLPWRVTTSWNGMEPSYNVSHLVSDMLSLLTPQMPTAVREETLRRAAIYSSRQAELPGLLESRLVARTQTDQNNPLAWFDAGYFAEATRVAAVAFPNMRAGLPSIDGLALIHKAIRLGGKDMDRAASLVAAAEANR
jgi:hypothetical protein